MNTNDLIENVNFKTNKTSYVYLSASSYNTYKIGHSFNPEKRVRDISIGNFWKHELLYKVQVHGLVPRLETNVLNGLEEIASRREGEMFLITKKTREEVIDVFKSKISESINEMRKQVRAKTRYETKILAKHGVNEVPVYTSIARV
jgi:hypothetical protein|tara:strand:- start:267 stop:704 length:438 start_codon:yes stop_codon:yes gene_type:complete